ncbi:MAG: pilus assembly PilX N-terminal domain-containing protein [Armatimonadetes bacterium]|nr:pilus assembly PilX N-terminal domain-containing protein [Akkermansiaceae bacterium]
MKPARENLSRYRGFALPMTIIAVAGLTLLLVGLITVLSLERKTARSYSDAARADLAVESGLATALASVTEITKSDDTIVFRLEDPVEPKPSAPTSERPLGYREQFFTYGAKFKNGAWLGIPLFSGAAQTPIGNDRINTQPLVSSLTTFIQDTVKLGKLTENDQNIPRAKWVDVPSTDPKGYNLRYSFWVEDLSGRINGVYAGVNKTLPTASNPAMPDMNVLVNTRHNTADINLFSVFYPDANPNSDPGFLKLPLPFEAENESFRNKLRTSASLRSYFNGNSQPDRAIDEKRIEPYVSYYSTTPPIPRPPAVIPQGFGYADAGLPAPDLNEFVSSNNIDALADHIERNLPDFKNRRGGFPASENYLKTIAASIIDYADEDNNSTTGSGYRGVDSYPFVNELFDRYQWSGGSGSTIEITVETYAEFWNPSQLPISGSIVFTNDNRHEIRIPPAATHNFSAVTFPAVQVAIPPNGFLVRLLGSRTYTFPTGAFPPSSLTFNNTTTSNFSLRWNGGIVDYARGGLQRTSGTLRPGSSQAKWKGNSSPALDYSIGQSGDPRSSAYISTWVFANNYDANTNWGGRCLKSAISNTNYNQVRLQEWADRGSNSSPGTSAGSDSKRPTEVIYPANQPEMAPAFISNLGRYHSLGELGNIYDPAQWQDIEVKNSSPNPNAGGGFTLAIGKPEFGNFDSEGRRSAQLLDLFSLENSTYMKTPGARPININTAPYEVLRTLAAGVKLDADPASPNVKPPSDAAFGDVFARFVTNQRRDSPLRGPSDLNNIRNNPLTPRDPTKPADTPFFGSVASYPKNPPSDNSWDDAGREELMRKIIHLVAFQSKTFRIVVSGEARDQKGKLMSRATREYHYSIEPERDSLGVVIPGGTPRIMKHYEKSL